MGALRVTGGAFCSPAASLSSVRGSKRVAYACAAPRRNVWSSAQRVRMCSDEYMRSFEAQRRVEHDAGQKRCGPASLTTLVGAAGAAGVAIAAGAGALLWPAGAEAAAPATPMAAPRTAQHGSAPAAEVRTGKKMARQELSRKLDQVPVFIVTSTKGEPFLAEERLYGGKPDSEVWMVPMFLAHEDALRLAEDMARRVKLSDTGDSKVPLLEPQVYVTTLNRALAMAKAGPQKSGVKLHKAELRMEFRLVPDRKAGLQAAKLSRELSVPVPSSGLPVFAAQGLTLVRDGKRVFPLFFDIEDLQTVWTQLREQRVGSKAGKSIKHFPKAPVVELGDAIAIVTAMEHEKTPSPDLEMVEFFPRRQSVAWIAENVSNASAAKAWK